MQVERSSKTGSRSGQATTEWMVVVAVLVIAVVSIGWMVSQTFPSDMVGLGSRARRMYASGNLAR